MKVFCCTLIDSPVFRTAFSRNCKDKNSFTLLLHLATTVSKHCRQTDVYWLLAVCDSGGKFRFWGCCVPEILAIVTYLNIFAKMNKIAVWKCCLYIFLHSWFISLKLSYHLTHLGWQFFCPITRREWKGFGWHFSWSFARPRVRSARPAKNRWIYAKTLFIFRQFSKGTVHSDIFSVGTGALTIWHHAGKVEVHWIGELQVVQRGAKNRSLQEFLGHHWTQWIRYESGCKHEK